MKFRQACSQNADKIVNDEKSDSREFLGVLLALRNFFVPHLIPFFRESVFTVLSEPVPVPVIMIISAPPDTEDIN